MEESFKEKRVDMKTCYSELVKMVNAWEKDHYEEGYNEAYDIYKIQGVNRLTIKMILSWNRKFLSQIQVLNNQNQEQQKQIDYLMSRIKDWDEQSTVTKDVLQTLEVRIDANENHITLLQNHEEQQDLHITDLEKNYHLFEKKMDALEQADTYLQEAQRNMISKAQLIEEEEKKLADSFDTMQGDLKTVRFDHEKLEQRVTKVEDKEIDLREKVEHLEDEQGLMKEDIETLKNMAEKNERQGEDKLGDLEISITDLKVKINELEDLGKENAEILNNVTIKNIQIDAKLEKIEEETVSLGSDLKADINKVKDRTEDNKDDIDGLKKEVREVDDKEETLEKILESIQPEFEKVKDRFAEFDKIQEEVEKEMNSMNEVLDEVKPLMEKVEIVEDKIKETDKAIENMHTDIVNNEEDLEKKANEIIIRIDSIDDNVKKVTTENLEKLENITEDLEQKSKGDLTDLLKKVNELEENVSENKKELSEAKDLIDDCSDKVNDIMPRLKKLDGQVDELESRVGDHDLNIAELTRDQLRQDDEIEKIKADEQSTDRKLSEVGEDQKSFDEKLKQASVDVEEFEDKLKNLGFELKNKLQDVEDQGMKNLEKLVNLEEQQNNQLEKAKYVEAINERINVIDAEKQQSEAKLKDELAATAKGNAERLDKLQEFLDGKIANMEEKLKDHDGDIDELKDSIDDIKQLRVDITMLKKDNAHVEDELKDLKDDIREDIEKLDNSVEKIKEDMVDVKKDIVDKTSALKLDFDELEKLVKENTKDIKELDKKEEIDIEDLRRAIDALKDSDNDDFKLLKDEVDNKLHEVDHSCEKNEKHVDNLRDLNNKLLEEIKKQVDDELTRQARVTDDIRADNDKNIEQMKLAIDIKINDIENLKKEDIEELFKARAEMLQSIGVIEIDVGKLKEELAGIENKQDDTVSEIRDTKILINENFSREIREQIETVDEKLKERVDVLEEDVGKLNNDCDRHETLLKNMDLQMTAFEKDLKEVDSSLGIKLEETGKHLQQALKTLSKYLQLIVVFCE